MKERNKTVDIIRGIAILLVVLGHVMAVNTLDAENSFLYNLIWSLQMPLFFVISGYITKYQREISTLKALGTYIGKRTMSYILPWAVWTFVVRGFIFGNERLMNIKYLIWHMDSGYWFLFSIWMITIFYAAATYFANVSVDKIIKKPFLKIPVFMSVIFVFMCILVVLAKFMGTAFLGIKYTMYYLVFYICGYLFGKVQPLINNLKCGSKVISCAVAICSFLYVLLLTRYNTFYLSETVYEIFMRIVISLLGIAAVCGLISSLADKLAINIKKAFCWGGSHSLEIYLSHYLFLRAIKPDNLPVFASSAGYAQTFASYVMTLALTIALICFLEHNYVLNKWLFGKTLK